MNDRIGQDGTRRFDLTSTKKKREGEGEDELVNGMNISPGRSLSGGIAMSCVDETSLNGPTDLFVRRFLMEKKARTRKMPDLQCSMVLSFAKCLIGRGVEHGDRIVS